MKKQKNSRIISNIVSIDPYNYNSGIIAQVVDILMYGGVIAFPTQGLYGLGADAFNLAAVERVFTIKKRSSDKPLLVLVPDRDAVNEVVADIPPAAMKLMDCFWPGRVTIIFKAHKGIPEILVAGTGKIGVRVSGHPVTKNLVSMFRRPVTGTSANLSGKPGCRRIEDIDPLLLEQLDLVLDAGPLAGGKGSTVVDVTAPSPVIIREGAISKQKILAALV
jgi:L-threonylcarbamoyladenylate synthase